MVTAPGAPGVNSDYLIDLQRAAADGGRTFDATQYSIQSTTDNIYKKVAATSNPPTSSVCGVSPMAGRDQSRTRVGASTVAGVAATTAGALTAGAADGSTEGSD